MLINKLMSVQLGMVHWDDIEEISLSSELNEIVTQGFVEMDGCFFVQKNYFHIVNLIHLVILRMKLLLSVL
ncbi:hypothetical protein C6H68_22615 [Photorhabdus luminescens]|nr:hypothetical protein C6H68_22615 [Photorhabdus luminescens]